MCALHTGNMGIPPKDMSKWILEAVSTYLRKHQYTMLRTIDVVIFKESMVADFEKAMKSAIQEKSKSLMSKIGKWMSGVSDWVFGGKSIFQ